MKAYLPEVGYGLALALAHLVWLIVEYTLGLHSTRIAQYSILTNLYVVIAALILWRAIKNRRDVLEGGQLLWWQGMTSGMIVSVVSAALRGPTWWFFLKFINPGFTQAMVEFAVQSGTKREFAEVTYHPTVMAMESTLSPVLLGFFLSLGLTWFARSQVEKPQSPAEA